MRNIAKIHVHAPLLPNLRFHAFIRHSEMQFVQMSVSVLLGVTMKNYSCFVKFVYKICNLPCLFLCENMRHLRENLFWNIEVRAKTWAFDINLGMAFWWSCPHVWEKSHFGICKLWTRKHANSAIFLMVWSISHLHSFLRPSCLCLLHLLMHSFDILMLYIHMVPDHVAKWKNSHFYCRFGRSALFI